MASNPPSNCCVMGVVHDGESKGNFEHIDGVQIYVAKAEIPRQSAVLILTDVFGPQFVNVQLIADNFASRGYDTYIPDLFDGKPIPTSVMRGESFNVPGWLNQHGIAEVEPTVTKVIEALREKYKRIGAVGYCFGAKYVVRHLANGRGIDVGYVAHPSFVEDAELEAINGPLSIAADYNDRQMTNEKRYKSEDILVATKQPFQINLYSHVEHGFALKADLSSRQSKYAMQQAFEQAITWFTAWLDERSASEGQMC